MKPILLALIFWGCAFFLSAAGLPGYYYSGRFGVDMLQPEVYDTAVISPDLMADVNAANHLQKILPQPGSKLNYTQIMFEHPQVSGADEYMIEVTLDDRSNSFVSPLVKRIDSSTATLLSNFEFGNKYVWRYTGMYKGKELGWNGPYNFEILNSPAVDKKLFRVSVLQNDSLLNAGGLIVLDRGLCIVDRNGKFVWFFPPENNRPEKKMKINDLRITPFGTITFMYSGKAQERDLNGNILWNAPPQNSYTSGSADTTPVYSYHHCFKRLSISGNYMALDQVTVSKSAAIFGKQDISPVFTTGPDSGKISVAYDIIKEFDKTGKLVWSWNSENYFDTVEVRNMVRSKPDSSLRNRTPGGHMNAFDVDEKNQFVYAGFRNVSRVIKIDKKTGQVVCAWGDNMSYNGKKNGDGFFLKQHGTTLLHDGSIAVFSNNILSEGVSGKSSSASSAIIFSQPSKQKNSQIIWKFDCNVDSTNNLSQTGGNVEELKNGNLLVGMGDVNRVFEITRKKEIVWSASMEKYDEHDLDWHKLTSYRAYCTSSLYPCYFTIQTNCDTLNENQPSFRLKLFNDGTEDDSYNVEISSSFGYYKQQFSASVQAVKSRSFTISPKVLPISGDLIKVTVTSKTNPDFKRIAYLQYIK